MNYTTPSGFRDILADEAARREAAAFDVQQLLSKNGYVPVETPTLEIMDVMNAGGRVPGTPFKLFDSRGDLLALRPDVTLQIARMCATRLAGQPGPFRFRYQERVFREAEGRPQAEAREMTQVGVELIGEAGPSADAEVIALLAESLEQIGVGDFRISVATVGVLRALLAGCGADEAWKSGVLSAYHASNFVKLDELTGPGAQKAGVAPVFAQAIRALANVRGGREAVARVRDLVAPLGCQDGLADLEQTLEQLDEKGLADRIFVDFSVMSSFDYYTGIVFVAFAPALGAPLGSGGRYDNTIGAYGENRPAAGFAFYLDQALAAAASSRRAGVRCASPCPKARSTPTPSRALRRAASTRRASTTQGASSSSATPASSTSSCGPPMPRCSWSLEQLTAASAEKIPCLKLQRAPSSSWTSNSVHAASSWPSPRGRTSASPSTIGPAAPSA